jgi:hypothetical protein
MPAQFGQSISSFCSAPSGTGMSISHIGQSSRRYSAIGFLRLFEPQKLLEPSAIKSDNHLIADDDRGRATRAGLLERIESVRVFVDKFFRKRNPVM